MNVRWSAEAAADFTGIVQHIRKDNATAALRVARTIYQTIEQLSAFPTVGGLAASTAQENYCSRRFRLLWCIV